MELDREKIFSLIGRIKSTQAEKEELREALGGEQLKEIFDENTIEAILSEMINFGKVHNLINDGDGLDILQNLLNSQIEGDISSFYSIKPEYILNLPEEERQKMADSIAGDWKELSVALQKVWRRRIKTSACTTKKESNLPMIQFEVDEHDYESQAYLQSVYEQDGIECANAFYSCFTEGGFTINLQGEKLYRCLCSDALLPTRERKTNIFEKTLEDTIKSEITDYEYYLTNDIDTTKIYGASIQELGNKLIKAKTLLDDIINRKSKISIKDMSHDEIKR